MLVVPNHPQSLKLTIGRLWNGERCPDSRISVLVELLKKETGILLQVIIPKTFPKTITESFPGKRIENFDGLEYLSVFLVEEGGQYLEIRLTIGGQYLVLGFDSPHQLVADFKETPFLVNHFEKEKQIINEILIPQELSPTNLSALNAFLTVGNQQLAYYPLSGKTLDCHQTNLFPLARLEE